MDPIYTRLVSCTKISCSQLVATIFVGGVFFLAAACGDGGDSEPPDATQMVDGAGPLPDAMSLIPDAMAPDATASDAMAPDAALPDAMLPDAMLPDAAPPPDAMLPDAMPPDAGSHPIGPLGAGLSTLLGYSDNGFIDGPRTAALLNNPVNVHVGPGGNVYVADFDNGVVRKVTPAGLTTTLVQQANFNRPFGMVFDANGVFYVQTDRNSLDQSTGALWTVALDTGVATLAIDDLGRVRGLAALSDGRIAMADVEAHTLQIFDPLSGIITPLAGQAGSPAHVDGTGAAARFNRPLDIVVNVNDELFVADSENNRIRHVTLAGVVTTIAGNGVENNTDGPALTSSIAKPAGLALLGERLFISEFDSGQVRLFADGTLSTVAGTIPGFADNADPLLGLLNQNEGIDVDGTGTYLYIADGNGGDDGPFHRVRRLEVPALPMP